MIFTHVNSVVRNSRIKVSVAHPTIKQFTVFVQFVYAWDGQERGGAQSPSSFLPPT